MGTLHIYFLFVSLILQVDETYGQLDDATLQLISRTVEKQEEQANIIGQQQEQLTKLTNQLAEQQTKLSQQNTQIEALKEFVRRHEATISILQEDLMKQNMEYKTEVGENIPETKPDRDGSHASQKGQIKAKVRQDRLVVDPEGPVAFHATVNKAEVSHIGIDQKVVFETVLINLGTGYHNQHGIFIAPQSGLYLFSTSILSFVNDHSEIGVGIMKNGNVLARAYGHGDSGRHDQGSVTVVTQLNTGDEVWVSMTGPADDSLWGGGFTSFAGCLIALL